MVELAGEGGMGEVYRAEDLKLGQPVALKFLPQELARDPERLEALVAEIRLARQVTHPNVCRVHDLEEMDGTYFLSMEFVDGEDLASLLRRIRRLPSDKAIEITREICAGLSAIHDRDVLHRDLKPTNVMIDGRGHARITDFGLAQLRGAGADPYTIVGTPAYMAPEALVGSQSPTVQSDLYSLGLLMYELFTGRPPFEATTLGELIRVRSETPPPSPSKLQRDIDPAVERVILHCLERDPQGRPASAPAVAAALPAADPLAAAIAAGKTPSPELVAADTSGAEGLRPALAWSCLAALVAGLALLVAVAPSTRLVPRLSLPEPPEAMAGRARELLRDFGLREASVDAAYGYDFDESAVDRIVARERSPSRWDGIAHVRPPVVTFWYRESPTELVPAGPWYRVSYSDPPLIQGGMVGVKLDGRGRLWRLDAPPAPRSRAAAASLDPDVLFRAAGLALSDFRPVPPDATPNAAGDLRLAWVGHDQRHPLRVEMVAFQGRPTSFEVREPGTSVERGAETPPDPSRRATAFIQGSMRPALFLAAMFLGAWLARRNLRAGRGDPKRAVRLASAMLVLRILVWALGAHYTPASLTDQIMSTLAWGFYDFVYGWLFYVAIEPYVRRLWPRLLTSWARFLNGRFADPRVGRDLLIGCLAGTIIALVVAGHQAAPALFGDPPGRPDNVGYVERQLTSLLGLRHQLAEIFWLARSNIVLVMGFMVILVMARIGLRSAAAALVATFMLFLPLALPRGEFLALNLGLAVVATFLLLVVLLRFGLLAGGVSALTHATLESAPLGMGLGSWPTSRTALVVLIVLGVGVYGFTRSLGGRPAIRDVLE